MRGLTAFGSKFSAVKHLLARSGNLVKAVSLETCSISVDLLYEYLANIAKTYARGCFYSSNIYTTLVYLQLQLSI
jgi:hypothetical protein